MMADLIRTSMFCDVNDVFTDDEQRFLVDIEHTCIPDASYCDNFLEFMARTSDSVDEVSSAHEISLDPLQQQQQQQQQTQQQMTYNAENDVTIIDQQTISIGSSCHSSVATEETCQDFLSRIVQASKVDLCTFNNVAASEIFGNDYLQPVVFDTETNSPVKQTQINDSKPVRTSVKITRPPYSYTACAVAAIYLSGKDCLSTNAIMEKLCSMFEEVRPCRSQFRKHLSKTLKTNKLFKQVDRDIYSVVPGRVNRNVFHRQYCVNQDQREKYADMIHNHLEIPSMLKHFGIELTTTVKCSQKKRVNVVSDLLKYRKSVKEQLQSVRHVNENTGDLEMPGRPCFHDNSDNEDDEMLKNPLGRNISPVSVEPFPDNANVYSDESRSCVETVESERIPPCADNVTYTPAVVVPVPRYAVPTPSACVPLRCQDYHIPYVGTFRLVDMYYNGQIIHQLYS
ncbi:uncharacterized protein LOC128556722 [Mercenaria mercenaria]|uniref:uncharacterized protein LOC128556722 n=1 Tax=Mercenaria mercenaria TaxID=6596 RepID=UPI00234F1B13|nr:uncharacterized protein LOC128556722 [Mercenaria mercenaria]